jgi:hypothetical protein
MGVTFRYAFILALPGARQPPRSGGGARAFMRSRKRSFSRRVAPEAILYRRFFPQKR